MGMLMGDWIVSQGLECPGRWHKRMHCKYKADCRRDLAGNIASVNTHGLPPLFFDNL